MDGCASGGSGGMAFVAVAVNLRVLMRWVVTVALGFGAATPCSGFERVSTGGYGPRGAANPEVARCAKSAADELEVPHFMVLLVLDLEGGRVGEEVTNANGSADVGPMQVNTWWLPRLERLGITREMLRESACVNVYVGTYILKDGLVRHGTLVEALAHYHSPTAGHQARYLRRAVEALDRRLAEVGEAMGSSRSPAGN